MQMSVLFRCKECIGVWTGADWHAPLSLGGSVSERESGTVGVKHRAGSGGDSTAVRRMPGAGLEEALGPF